MRNVMKRAWEIAREGQEKFGGKVSEYLSAALKIAWALIKKGANKMEMVINERKTRQMLEEKIMKTEWTWITPTVLNELLDQGIESINRNVVLGNIDGVNEDVINHVSFLLIDQLH